MTLKEFMDKAWVATEVCGLGFIVDRRVCYGSEPDIQLTVEMFNGDIDFVSAKELFALEVGVK